MEESFRIKALNISLNVTYYCLIIILTYFLSPIHEVFHYIPCKAIGLTPDMSYFRVDCFRIETKSLLYQFLFFMGPYLFEGIILVVLFKLADGNNYWKYAIPLPAFDLLSNYISIINRSDFKSLIQNTYPSKIPFYASMALVSILLLITARAYYKYRIYSFNFLIRTYILKRRNQ